MRDQIMDLEQQLTLTKQRYREASEEVEGIRTELNDMKMQTDDYREKVLILFFLASVYMCVSVS